MNDRFNSIKFASPATFYPAGRQDDSLFLGRGCVFGLAGPYLGMLVAPTDFQQGEGYRIIFIHVPASWMSHVHLFGHGLLGRHRPGFQHPPVGHDGQALAPTGALIAFLCRYGPAPCGASRCGARGGCGTPA